MFLTNVNCIVVLSNGVGRRWHILQTELALHEFTFTARAASNSRRPRSRLTRSSADMAVLIDG